MCIGPSLVVSLKTLGSSSKYSQLSLFCSYYFGRCSSELAELVPLPHFCGSFTRYSDRLHDFFVTFPRCYKNFYVNSFSSHTARFCNSLPAECFPMIYDINDFRYRVNRHLFSLGSFNTVFLYDFLFFFLFLVTPSWSNLHGAKLD